MEFTGKLLEPGMLSQQLAIVISTNLLISFSQLLGPDTDARGLAKAVLSLSANHSESYE